MNPITTLLLAFAINQLQLYAKAQQNWTRYCYASDENPYQLHNTETAYEFIHETNEVKDLPDACEPIFIIMVARHGTRYPNLGLLRLMSKRLPVIKDIILKSKLQKFCPEDIELFKIWNPINVSDEIGGQVHAQGVEDFKKIALRMKKTFPQLFKGDYAPDKFKFHPSPMKRTSDSATAFAKGMWPKANIKVLPGSPDALTFAFELCKEYIRKTQFHTEHEKFLQTDIFKKAVTEINISLGIFQDLQLAAADLILMHSTCGYEKGLNLQSKSTWCSVFTKENIQIIQYLRELDKYYMYSYGNNKTFNIACPLMSSIFKSLSELVKSGGVQPQDPVGIFYFAHWEMLSLLSTGLGLFQNDVPPLTGTGYASKLHSRHFNSSWIASFASNVQIVLYRCKSNERFRIMIRWQEKPILNMLSKCDQNGLCSWEEFNSYMSDRLNRTQPCNLSVCDS